MKALFICNMNMHRSKTAEEMFSDRFETDSAGIYNNIVTSEQLEWADIVFVMEEIQRTRLGELYPKQYMKKRILNLEIPDVYRFNQPELVELLKQRMKAIEATFQKSSKLPV